MYQVVEGNWKNEDNWYQATITRVRADETVDLLYYDGETEVGVPQSRTRAWEPSKFGEESSARQRRQRQQRNRIAMAKVERRKQSSEGFTERERARRRSQAVETLRRGMQVSSCGRRVWLCVRAQCALLACAGGGWRRRRTGAPCPHRRCGPDKTPSLV